MVASQYGRLARIQLGGWHCLACLLFGVLKVAPGRRVGARFDLIEGARRASGPV